jgi:hypothetical protein
MTSNNESKYTYTHHGVTIFCMYINILKSFYFNLLEFISKFRDFILSKPSNPSGYLPPPEEVLLSVLLRKSLLKTKIIREDYHPKAIIREDYHPKAIIREDYHPKAIIFLF